MKLNNEEWMGRKLPKWYGISYHLIDERVTVVHLIPLNIIIGAIRTMYFFLKQGCGDYVETFKEKLHLRDRKIEQLKKTIKEQQKDDLKKLFEYFQK